MIHVLFVPQDGMSGNTKKETEREGKVWLKI